MQGTGGNRYTRLIAHIFESHYAEGSTEIPFERDEIALAAEALGVRLPKNLGDLIYSFRYRGSLPKAIQDCAPEGHEWIIRPAGRGRYKFVATSSPVTIHPDTLLADTKIPDATPGLIELYALNDEQALLAKLRYNRRIDIFTGVSCYSLQSHLRTQVRGLGQVETDEVYVGVDQRGVHYVFPVQAKGGHDHLNVVQIEQDVALCAAKFPHLVCRPIAAQFLAEDLIALFGFEQGEYGVVKNAERHYRLVPADELSPDDLARYRLRPE